MKEVKAEVKIVLEKIVQINKSLVNDRQHFRVGLSDGTGLLAVRQIGTWFFY